ncbi:hypothetical protein EI74_0813 [Mycoplasma testudineum]|uniref:Lipoprotein n=1 Tax=Mycoplasma testudineum TaxID=244584 RepID=A0A4R6IB27_9MOLU|nr:hypothetical protein [Mycoplasma testudineum]OYD26508.1 hypothetical protein CG473_03640 [Mycoplasma testudineum]TDO18994.1 hypothetical protein EI74_0813 [Mycoplasma testudineum]
MKFIKKLKYIIISTISIPLLSMVSCNFGYNDWENFQKWWAYSQEQEKKVYLNEEYTIANYGYPHNFSRNKESVETIFDNIYGLDYTDIEHSTEFGKLYQSKDIIISNYEELRQFVEKQIAIYNTESNFSDQIKNENLFDYSIKKTNTEQDQKINWNDLFTKQNNIRLLNLLIWKYDEDFFSENNLILTQFSFDKKFRINKYKYDFFRYQSAYSGYTLYFGYINVDISASGWMNKLNDYYQKENNVQLKDLINGFISLTQAKKSVVVNRYKIDGSN